MLKKKICMLGEFGVGKTSLVRQYVHHVYSEDYISTIGVHISKKDICLLSGEEMTLLLWDIEGQDEITEYARNYLRGMSAYFLVADGTRPETLKTALKLGESLSKDYADLPYSILLNKFDLSSQWCLKEDSYTGLVSGGTDVILTSAKTGQGVEDVFKHIAEKAAGS